MLRLFIAFWFLLLVSCKSEGSEPEPGPEPEPDTMHTVQLEELGPIEVELPEGFQLKKLIIRSMSAKLDNRIPITISVADDDFHDATAQAYIAFTKDNFNGSNYEQQTLQDGWVVRYQGSLGHVVSSRIDVDGRGYVCSSASRTRADSERAFAICRSLRRSSL